MMSLLSSMGLCGGSDLPLIKVCLFTQTNSNSSTNAGIQLKSHALHDIAIDHGTTINSYPVLIALMPCCGMTCFVVVVDVVVYLGRR